jgi:hypothetical protein
MNGDIVTRKHYIFYGGGDGPVGTGVLYNGIWTYSLVTGIWSTAPVAGELLEPARGGCVYGTAALISDWIFLFGGQDEKTIFGNVIAYDSVRRTFVESKFPATMAQPPERMQHGEFVRGGRMYIFGGTSQLSYLNDFWEFTPAQADSPAGGVWTWINATGSVPPPMTSPTYVFDGDSTLWLWHGQYELFNKNDDRTTAMYQYSFFTRSWTKSQMLLETTNAQGQTVQGPFPVLLNPCAWKYTDATSSYLYVYGGAEATGNLSNSFYRLDTVVPSVNGTQPPFVWKSVTFNITSPLVGRRGHDCQVSTDGFPLKGIFNTPVMFMFGGMTYDGVSNELWALDHAANVRF